MLTEPKIADRTETRYLGVVLETAQPDLPRTAPPAIDRLFAALGRAGIAPAGPMMFRYHSMDGGQVVLDVAVPVEDGVVGADGLIAGALPAGRYASIEYTGPYEGLYGANGALHDWMGDKGLAANETGSGTADGWAEIYHVGPETTADPARWRTEVAIKVAD